MTETRPIERTVLNRLLENPRAFRDDPYMFFIAYLWDRLKGDRYQFLYDDEDPDDVPGYDEFDIDGMEMDARTFSIILMMCADDMEAAQKNRLTLRINNKPYRVPAQPPIDPGVIPSLVPFKQHDGVVVISKSAIRTLGTWTADDGKAREARESRRYLHKIAWLAENTDDGWDRLTDMEAVAYAWAVRMAGLEGVYARDAISDIVRFVGYVNRNICDMGIDGLTECWLHEFSSARISADSQFSSSLIMEWNAENGQVSLVQDVDGEAAEDFWSRRSAAPPEPRRVK